MSAAIETAIRLLHESRHDEAEVAFRDILARDPQDLDAQHGLAVVAFQRGDHQTAEARMNALLTVAPALTSARYDFACMLIAQQRDTEAVELLRRVVSELPEHANAWYQLGFALKMQDKVDEAEAAFCSCLALAPGHTAATNDLARLLRDRGDYPAAIAAFERAAASGQAEPDLYHNWWQFASLSALPAEGLKGLQAGVREFPVESELRIDLAAALEGNGGRALAEQQYRVALGLDARRGFALGSLLSLMGGSADNALVQHAQRIVASPSVPPSAKAIVAYGLGKVLQQRNDYRGAFEAWSQANAARRMQIGAMDRAVLLEQVADNERSFAREDFQSLQSFASNDERLVFIVGMPRSGTTLIEQIIASHPDAEGLGELPDLPIVAENFRRRLGSSAQWPVRDVLRASAGPAIADAAGHYSRVVDYRLSRPVVRAIDKSPLNFFYVGLVGLMFPRARIIWCRRDPRDVCLSIFSENFADSQKYATDLADLGFCYRQHERLMRHWQATVPNPIREVVYEEMVEDQEAQTRALIDFVGLPWDPACLQFHSSTRSVQTPSRWQVRQPMYKTSMQRWRHYEPWLQPLLAELDATS